MIQFNFHVEQFSSKLSGDTNKKYDSSVLMKCLASTAHPHFVMLHFICTANSHLHCISLPRGGGGGDLAYVVIWGCAINCKTKVK